MFRLSKLEKGLADCGDIQSNLQFLVNIFALWQCRLMNTKLHLLFLSEFRYSDGFDASKSKLTAYTLHIFQTVFNI